MNKNCDEYIICQPLNLKNKIKQNRNRLTGTENILMVVRWEGFGRLGEKVRELISTNLLLQSSHEDVKYGVGNIVSNILTTRYGVRWV